jgi:hypothetical protein
MSKSNVWCVVVSVFIYSALFLPTWADAPVPPPAKPTTDTAPAQEPQKLAAKIDELISAGLAGEGVQPAALADDAEFLRRVYLDLAGRIPVTKDVRDFLDDKTPDKRSRLIERLLESGLYVHHFSNVFRALLLPQNNNPEGQLLIPGFEAWLRLRIGKNQPYDELVREILTGPTMAAMQNRNRMRVPQEPTPAAFYQANERKPENLAAATSRLFLGIKLECAQCHDHKTAHWTRKQFWEFAAFFAGVPPLGQIDAPPAGKDMPEGRSLRIPGTERIALAHFLDGTEPQWGPDVQARPALAKWTTSPANHYFARATVNRLWAHFFGRGIVEPVDEESEQNPPSHPELLDELARQFVGHGYDLKFLIRAITHSQTYQRTSLATHPSQQEPRLFARMALKGLSPEQFFDSLAQATGYYDESAPSPRLDSPGANTPRAQFLAKFANQEKRTEFQTSILQALALMNGKFVDDATSIERSRTLAAVIDSPFLSNTQRLETLYLAALSRRPRSEELDGMLKYVSSGGPKGNEQAALGDVFWALLNSAEFMLNH